MGDVAAMIAQLRDLLYRAIVSSQGDTLTPVRLSKDVARRVNTALGRPLAPQSELQRRSAARERLKSLRAKPATSSAATREAAPVLIYFEAGRNARELGKIEELLGAKALTWKRLDVGGDEATLDFVTRKAGCERDALPVVFVADHAIGPFESLVRADVSGELERLVRSP